MKCDIKEPVCQNTRPHAETHYFIDKTLNQMLFTIQSSMAFHTSVYYFDEAE